MRWQPLYEFSGSWRRRGFLRNIEVTQNRSGDFYSVPLQFPKPIRNHSFLTADRKQLLHIGIADGIFTSMEVMEQSSEIGCLGLQDLDQRRHEAR